MTLATATIGSPLPSEPEEPRAPHAARTWPAAGGRAPATAIAEPSAPRPAYGARRVPATASAPPKSPPPIKGQTGPRPGY